MAIDIWIIHSEKRILVSDYPGPPAAICGFISEEARAAAQQRGFATVSEIGFPTECHLSAEDWSEAKAVAEAKAKELGYRVKQEDMFMDSFLAMDDEEWEPEFDDEFYDLDLEPDDPEEEEA
ncbi:MAG: hypothetical protein KJ077_08510 [Anaerolineae bacterium]|nr:hypothetical protein [Anaerolineae bacterium]